MLLQQFPSHAFQNWLAYGAFDFAQHKIKINKIRFSRSQMNAVQTSLFSRRHFWCKFCRQIHDSPEKQFQKASESSACRDLGCICYCHFSLCFVCCRFTVAADSYASLQIIRILSFVCTRLEVLKILVIAAFSLSVLLLKKYVCTVTFVFVFFSSPQSNSIRPIRTVLFEKKKTTTWPLNTTGGNNL